MADFGIARAIDDAAGLTRTGNLMASIAYTAPERLKSVAVDHRADVYSLGCTLFHLLTGRTPFPADGGSAAVVAAHLFEAPPKITDLVPALAPAFDAVVAKAMAKNPDDRYQSAGELAADATAAFATTADGPSHTRPWRDPEGSRGGVLKPGDVVVADDDSSIVSAPSTIEHPEERTAPPPSRRRLAPGGVAVIIAGLLIGGGLIAGAFTLATRQHGDGRTPSPSTATTAVEASATDVAHSSTCRAWKSIRAALEATNLVTSAPAIYDWNAPGTNEQVASQTAIITEAMDIFEPQIADEPANVAVPARAYVAARREEVRKLNDHTYTFSDIMAPNTAVVQLDTRCSLP